MGERPRFFDDLAGVAGGAFSALAGLREELEGTVRARVDEAIRRFDLVKREDLEAVQEMAATARAGQEAAELRLAALEAKVAGMESKAAMASGAGMASGPIGTGMPTPMPGTVSGTEAPPAAMPAGLGEGAAPFVPPETA